MTKRILGDLSLLDFLRLDCGFVDDDAKTIAFLLVENGFLDLDRLLSPPVTIKVLCLCGLSVRDAHVVREAIKTRSKWESTQKKKKKKKTVHETDSSHPKILVERPGVIRARKPVILLYPPEKTLVTLDLQLCDEWTMTHTYPSPTAIDLPHKKVAWTVNAEPDGTLRPVATGPEAAKQFSYIFWEAEQTPAFSLCIDFEKAFCCPGRDAGSFLDSLLLEMGLNTRERNDMVTYWLPGMKKREWVVLQFVEQNVYERWARLTVTPKPDVVFRLLMLFAAVGLDHGPMCRGSNQTLPRLADRKSKFVVVEWGGLDLSPTAVH